MLRGLESLLIELDLILDQQKLQSFKNLRFLKQTRIKGRVDDERSIRFRLKDLIDTQEKNRKIIRSLHRVIFKLFNEQDIMSDAQD